MHYTVHELLCCQLSLIICDISISETPTGPFIKLNYEEVSELSLVDLDFGRDKLTCHSYRGNPAAELLIVLTSSVNEIPLTPTWGQTTYSEASLFDVIVGITPTTNQTFISNIYKYDSLVCILVHPTLEAPRYKDVTFINPTSSLLIRYLSCFVSTISKSLNCRYFVI